MRSCRNKKKNGDDENGNLTLYVQLNLYVLIISESMLNNMLWITIVSTIHIPLGFSAL